MRYFYDTEFLDTGRTIDLISIGIVAADGREYHAHLDDYDRAAAEAHPFVGTEVLPRLTALPQTPRAVVADEVARFLDPGTRPELWGWFPAYDHVCLSQLWGTMLDPPPHIPQRTNCVAQLGQWLHAGRPPVENPAAHDALSDARWARDVYAWLVDEYARSAVPGPGRRRGRQNVGGEDRA